MGCTGSVVGKLIPGLFRIALEVGNYGILNFE